MGFQSDARYDQWITLKTADKGPPQKRTWPQITYIPFHVVVSGNAKSKPAVFFFKLCWRKIEKP